jgi:hypothetical protein
VHPGTCRDAAPLSPYRWLSPKHSVRRASRSPSVSSLAAATSCRTLCRRSYSPPPRTRRNGIAPAADHRTRWCQETRALGAPGCRRA